MTRLLLRNVGDGLNFIINNQNNYDLTVDFGGNENIECYCSFEDSFMLSHFHADHYDGILKCYRNHCHWNLKKFYFPAMPAFAESKEFFLCLLAMNIRISNNHPIQNSIFDLVRKLNRSHLDFIPISKGDIVVCDNRKYEILWPPKKIEDDETIQSIRNAIHDFEIAKESDSNLREIYQRVYSNYEDRDINTVIENQIDTDFQINEFNKDFSKIIQTANNSLRSAANRLSIAFRQDDNILFLGDLESKEIRSVVSNLKIDDNLVYDILIAPHHGTHWHNSLYSISCEICLASVGRKLRRYINYRYLDISEKFVRTDEWGDILIESNNRIK